jgi:hypothetical protein
LKRAKVAMVETNGGQQRRILLVDPECLLAAALSHLLSREPGIVVATVSSASRADLDAAVRDYAPHAVVMPFDDMRFIPENFLSLLNGTSATRLIFVSPNCNVVQVYDLSEVSVTRIDDLLGLLRGSAQPRTEGGQHHRTTHDPPDTQSAFGKEQ